MLGSRWQRPHPFAPVRLALALALAGARPRARARGVMLALVVGAGSIGAGCSSNPATTAGAGSSGSVAGGAASASSTSTTPSSPGVAAAAGVGWSGAFGQVPAFRGSDGVTITAVDFARMREHLGIEPTDPVFGGKAADTATFGARLIPTFWRTDPSAWEDAVGFLPFAPDRAIEISRPGSFSVAVLEGTFDVERVTSALRENGGMGEAVSVSHAGQSYLQAPGEEMRVSPQARKDGIENLGRPQRILVAPDHVIVSLTDDGMRQAIDAWEGRGAAGGDPALAKAARALDEVGAITVVSESGASEGRAVPGSTPRSPASSPPVDRGDPAFPLFVGAALDDGGEAGAYLVAMVGSDDAAAAAVEALTAELASGTSVATRQRWREVVQVRALAADGSLVVGTFTTDRPSILIQALLRREPLLDL